MKSKICTNLIILFILTAPFSAKSEEIIIRRQVMDTEFPNSEAVSIAQDKAGNIWMATADGLRKFNGYDTDTFRQVKDDLYSLGSDKVKKIYADSLGRLWIGTDAGLSVYDEEKELFHNFGEDAVNDIVEISSGRLFVSTASGLRMFDSSKMEFVKDGIPEFMSNVETSSLCKDGRIVYIGTENMGLFLYDLNVNEFRRLSTFLIKSRINVIFKQDKERIWIGSEGNGLFCMDPQLSQITHIRYTSRHRTNKYISSDYVRTIEEDHLGRLWVGTFNGLNIYEDGALIPIDDRHITTECTDGIGPNSIRSLFRDNQDGIWIGTAHDGIYRWNPEKDRFKTGRVSARQHSEFSDDITCIASDSEHNIWIGTRDGDIVKADSGGNGFRHFPVFASNKHYKLGNKAVNTIYADNEYLYIGAVTGGLKIMDKRNGTISQPDTGADTPQNIFKIARADKNNLYVAAPDGLWIYNIGHKRFYTAGVRQDLEKPQEVTHLIIDNDGLLWTGGDNGICVYRIQPMSAGENVAEEGRLTLENVTPTPIFGAISSMTEINDIFVSSTSDIWISTDSGLYAYSKKNGALRLYSEKEGFSESDGIATIEEDSYGRLWLGTKNGISCFNPFSDTLSRYSNEKGVKGIKFNKSSHCRSLDGTIYFGSKNGFIFFTPEAIRNNSFAPKPELTALYVMDRRIKANDGSGILEKSIGTAESFKIKPEHKYFTLEFAVANFAAGQDNSFLYKLEGFDDNWYKITDTRQVSYSNLPGGKYRFMLKAANNDGKWSDGITSIDIIVKPEWYRSTFAVILMILLTCSILFYTFTYIKRIREENKTLNEMLLQIQSGTEVPEGNLCEATSNDDSSINGCRTNSSETNDNITPGDDKRLENSDNDTQDSGIKELSAADEKFLNRAVLVIKRNINNVQYSTDTFASDMNMSRSNLHIRLKAITGDSALEFIHKIRFSEACRLLEEGRLSVTEISDKVGFSSPSYFATCFKRHFGCNPTEYCKNVKKSEND